VRVKVVEEVSSDGQPTEKERCCVSAQYQLGKYFTFLPETWFESHLDLVV
jgi:hypothetical protein